MIEYPSCVCETVTAGNDGRCKVCSGYWRVPRKASALTVREHFAAMAMQGLMGPAFAAGHFANYETFGMSSAEQMMAKIAVDSADALIAELAK